jgi:hypothetical protein
MQSHVARWTGWLLAALVVAACNGSGFDALDGVGIGRIAESEWIDMVVEAQCQQQMSCDCYLLAAPEGQDPYAFQLAQCQQHRRAELEHHAEQMKALGMRYDGNCAANRLAAASSWGCADEPHVARDAGSYRVPENECRVYYGDVAEGELCDTSPYDSCGWGLVCTYESYDSFDGLDHARRCRRAFGAGLGDECADWRVCAEGMYCSGDGYCKAYPEIGQSCYEGTCAPGSGCDYSGNGGGVCRELSADGATCNTTVGCLGVCGANNTCEMGSPAICRFDPRYP